MSSGKPKASTVEHDLTGACAAVAVSFVARVLLESADVAERELGRQLSELPPWQNLCEWRAALHRACDPYNLPSESEVATRSASLTLALSALRHALMARSSTNPATTHRNVQLASMKVGALYYAARFPLADMDELAQKALSDQAAKGGKARAAADPKSRAMAEVRAEWGQRSIEPGFKAAKFAAQMCEKHGLESSGHIEKQCSKWKKERSKSAG